VKTTKSIAFGFYNGLGDIISDLPIIKEFLKRDYFVEVFVYNWLVDFTKYLLPDALVKGVKDTKDIQNITIESEEFFLTPNYIHKFSFSKSSALSYLIKAILVKRHVKKVIKADILTVLLYTFDIKKTYLDQHFFDMSYHLISKEYDISLDEKTASAKDIKKLFVFPFSGRAQKDYPQEKFISVLKKIDCHNITVFVQENDRKKLHKEFFDFDVQSKSLKEITSLMDDETLVLANDSGPAHLAALKGSKVIALYLATEYNKYMPRGDVKAIDLRDGLQNSEEMILSVINSINFANT